MIRQLENNNTQIAKNMMAVFRESYAIEASLLNATDFPPLKRPLESYINSDNHFYGFYQNDELAAVIEIREIPEYTHIQSLVVSPRFFRMGIGSKLIHHVFDHYKSDVFMVETGADNDPAIQLYESFDFELIKQFDTDIGIKKVRFEKRMTN